MSADDGEIGVEEFAALLTELKERTERSYGSLARRLGMNTSTLHRYCAGDAVPQDFAPVERLAEFCGATPEERLELHRRWLRAAAVRQQRAAGRPGGQAVGTGAAEGSPDTAVAAAGAGAGAVGTTAKAHGAEAQAHGATAKAAGTEAQAHGAGAEAHGTTAKAAGTEAQAPGAQAQAPGTRAGGPGTTAEAAGTAAGPSAALDVPDAAEPAATADGSVPGGTSAVPRPWHRRRRSAALLGVACALLATLGTLSALPGGGGSPSASGDSPAGDGASPASASRPALRAAPRPAPDATPTPGPTTGGTPTRSAASGTASPASPTPGTPARGGAETSAAPAVPLAWTVDSHAWAQNCGHDYVIDRPPAKVPPPPAEQDAGPWATAQGAVHGRETNVEVSVQGRSSTAVVLTALRVRVVGRDTPLTGNDYAMDQGCGGSLTKRYFSVDLDKDRPIAHSVPGNDAGTAIPAVQLPYRVSAEDPEVLLVTARTETCDCSWYLELDWSSQGRTGTVRVDDHGRPFRTSGINGLPRYWYGTEGGRREWIPYT
ncbi:helix-turn-helix domain-containing protein [Streptomyces vulcanius]|uniref:Helix-turn-helix domain-containing protein n=3 Tax=Streptomyces TaxID=1883 RepID=A0ABV9II86_9ACTN